MQWYENNFWSKNLYTSIQERDGKLITNAFDIENQVISYLSTVVSAEEHLLLLKFKYEHFMRYLDKLSSNKRYYLVQRYKYNENVINDELDNEIMDEVSEIETAVHFRFESTIEEEKVDSNILDEDPQEYFKKMMELISVE